MSLIELLMREETEELPVRRIPYIHRATDIVTDKKGHNFAVFQSLPNSWLALFRFIAMLLIHLFSYSERVISLRQEVPRLLKPGTRDWPGLDGIAITDNISFSLYILMQCYKQCKI